MRTQCGQHPSNPAPHVLLADLMVHVYFFGHAAIAIQIVRHDNLDAQLLHQRLQSGQHSGRILLIQFGHGERHAPTEVHCDDQAPRLTTHPCPRAVHAQNAYGPRLPLLAQLASQQHAVAPHAHAAQLQPKCAEHGDDRAGAQAQGPHDRGEGAQALGLGGAVHTVRIDADSVPTATTAIALDHNVVHLWIAHDFGEGAQRIGRFQPQRAQAPGRTSGAGLTTGRRSVRIGMRRPLLDG